MRLVNDRGTPRHEGRKDIPALGPPHDKQNALIPTVAMATAGREKTGKDITVLGPSFQSSAASGPRPRRR
jgi:hypothetical protein